MSHEDQQTGIYEIDPKTDPGIARRNKALLNLERQRYGWLLLGVLVVIVDQLSKWAVTELILRPGGGVDFLHWYLTPPPPMPFIGTEVLPFFNLVMVWNTGVSFGILAHYGHYVSYLLIAVALFISGLFTKWLLETKDPFQGRCYALVIGGAMGNVIDRLRFGGVIDFLDFHAFGYHYPAFNLADACVCIGVGLLIIVSLFFDVKKKRGYRKKRKARHR